MAMANDAIKALFDLWKENNAWVDECVRSKDVSSFFLPRSENDERVSEYLRSHEDASEAVLRVAEVISARMLIDIITMMEQQIAVNDSGAFIAMVWNEQPVDLSGAREEMWSRLDGYKESS